MTQAITTTATTTKYNNNKNDDNKKNNNDDNDDNNNNNNNNNNYNYNFSSCTACRPEPLFSSNPHTNSSKMTGQKSSDIKFDETLWLL